MPADLPTTRIFLVRHGVAQGAEGIAVGQVDLPLSAAGAESLRRLASSWNGSPPDRLFASGLARSDDSAAILAQAWDLEVAIDERLKEMDFGDWDGRAWRDIRDTDGAFLEDWKDSWRHRPVPGGESMEDVARRAAEWIDQTLAAHAGETVVAVAHGGSIRTALCHVLGLPLERAFHLHLDHGRVSSVVTTFRGVEVEMMNAERFAR
jgi:broad specificity phosphatase PhoE